MTSPTLQCEPRPASGVSADCADPPCELAFDRRAGSYSATAIVQRHLIHWLGEWVAEPTSAGNATVVEVGAGDGLFTALLAKYSSRLTAIDIAPRMVERGRRRLPQVTWRVADAWQLGDCAGSVVLPEPPAGRGAIDQLFSASLLHLCERPLEVLRQWRRLVRPGGRMLHGFYIAPTLCEWQSVTSDHSPVRWRTASQWQSYFGAAGWRIHRCESRKHIQRFGSAIDLLRFLHRTGAVVTRRSPVGQLRRWIAEYDRRFSGAEGGSDVPSTWMFFRIELV